MKPIYWSKSRYEVIKLCPMKYYFQYILHYKTPMTKEQALGTFMHKRKEKLYKGKPGNLELKFKSAESFANSNLGMWKYMMMESGKIQGRDINWDFKGQQWSKPLLEQILDLSIRTYNKCANEEPPLYVEYNRDFIFDGFHFTVRMDEIRKNYLIREYKTGSSLPGEMALKHFTQFAFYSLAFCCFAHKDKEFAKICGVDEDEARSWAGNPTCITDRVKLEYYKVKDDTTLSTALSDTDYFVLRHELEDFEAKIYFMGTILYPNWGWHCDRCNYKIPCDEKTKNDEFHGIIIAPQLDIFPPKVEHKFRDKTLKIFPRKRKIDYEPHSV